MIETYFAAPHVLDRMRSGLMAPYLGALATEGSPDVPLKVAALA